jgi:hypothetical protein
LFDEQRAEVLFWYAPRGLLQMHKLLFEDLAVTVSRPIFVWFIQEYEFPRV